MNCITYTACIVYVLAIVINSLRLQNIAICDKREHHYYFNSLLLIVYDMKGIGRTFIFE